MGADSTSISIVGCGAMGAAIARAVIRKKVTLPTGLLLVDRDTSASARVAQVTGGLAVSIDDQRLRQSEVIILAVKPQDCAAACAALRDSVHPGQLVISIMAGIPLARLARDLATVRDLASMGAAAEDQRRCPALVRAMPNLPAQCGAGMTVYCCAPAISAAQQQIAQFIFESFGRSLLVESEDLIDSATALSGTGPAYFYFLLAQLQTVAVEVGYSAAEAELLLEQTMEGALALWRETGLSPAALIERVASRGGTTEAAFQVLRDGDSAAVIKEAIRAAGRRSRELAIAE